MRLVAEQQGQALNRVLLVLNYRPMHGVDGLTREHALYRVGGASLLPLRQDFLGGDVGEMSQFPGSLIREMSHVRARLPTLDMLPDPPHLTRSDVARVLGPVFTDRGQRYAADGHVIEVIWDPTEATFRGTVRGSGGRVYDTTAVWILVHEGQFRFVGGDCSCPMQQDCKHVAAIVLTGPTHPSVGTHDFGSPAEGVAAWDRTVDQWTVGHHGEPDERTIPLGLFFDLHGPRRFTVRLAKSTDRGWADANLEWRTITRWSGGYQVGRSQTFDDEHVRIAQAIHALSAVTSQFGAYSSAARDLNLSEFPHPQLWPLLEAAVHANMPLLTGRAGIAAVHLLQPGQAELRVDITTDDGEGQSVAPGVWVEGIPRTSLAFLGDPAHGVVLASVHGMVDPDLVLAPLTRPVPITLCDAAVSAATTVVPPEDRQRFAADGYLRLRQIAPVTSSDGSFVAPRISTPTLLLRVVPEQIDRLQLLWGFRYLIDDASRDCAVADSLHQAPWRDRTAEAELMAELSSIIGPATPAVVVGEDVIDVASRLIPALTDRPDAEVEVVGGNLPDYRDVSNDVQVNLATRLAPEERDWFDLDVDLIVDGKKVLLGTVFTALADGRTRLLLPDGGHLSLRTPELEQLRDLIEEATQLQERQTGQLTVSRYQVDLWEQLAALGVVTEQAEEWQRQVEGLLGAPAVKEVDVPEGFVGTMRPYQHEGLAWLSFLWDHQLGGILADDMGLGKTLQALAMILRARQDDPTAEPFLVLAPASVVHGWKTEAAQFAPDLVVRTVDATFAKLTTDPHTVADGADIVITSYTRFRLDEEEYAKVGWSGLLMDEAQALKNPRSKLYGCIRRLGAPFNLAITGTPMENNLMELWSLLSVTTPGLFPNPSVFKKMYQVPIQRNNDQVLLARFRRRIRPLVLRRTKEQVVDDLPPKQEQILSVELTPAHRKVYDGWLQRERRKVLGLMGDLDEHRFTVLRSLTRLRRASLHAGLVEDRHLTVASAKIEVLMRHLDEVVAGGHRALVFSQFTSFLALVRDRLDREGIDHVYLDGSTRNRQKVIAEFKEGTAPVFAISLKAGGVGLNLTEADYCFLLDPWWNPATESQAVDRTHRIGQTRTVMVYRLIARETIEEKVLDLNQRKAALFDGVMDRGQPFGGRLTEEDLRALFG